MTLRSILHRLRHWRALRRYRREAERQRRQRNRSAETKARADRKAWRRLKRSR